MIIRNSLENEWYKSHVKNSNRKSFGAWQKKISQCQFNHSVALFFTESKEYFDNDRETYSIIFYKNIEQINDRLNRRIIGHRYNKGKVPPEHTIRFVATLEKSRVWWDGKAHAQAAFQVPKKHIKTFPYRIKQLWERMPGCRKSDTPLPITKQQSDEWINTYILKENWDGEPIIYDSGILTDPVHYIKP